MIDKQTAIRRLTARWNEQCERFPMMRNETPLEMYLAINLANVRKHDLLASYDEVQS